ncbi:MAG: serine--glyoxylate aminotransferase, partial [Mesorhizobium sp.]
KVFRIGHLGALNEVMVLGALSAAELTLLDCGLTIEPGSGVGAAINQFRSAAMTATAKAA